MSALGGKADMAVCGCLLSRSLWGRSRHSLLQCLCLLLTQSGHRAVLHFICALMNEADIHRSALSRLLLRNLRNDDTLAKKIVQRVFQITDSCSGPNKLVACQYGTYLSRWRSYFAQARYSLPLTTSH